MARLQLTVLSDVFEKMKPFVKIIKWSNCSFRLKIESLIFYEVPECDQPYLVTSSVSPCSS